MSLVGDLDPETIVVVGMAGRFPKAANVSALWTNVRDGVDCVHDYTDTELAELGIGASLRADPAFIRAHGRLDSVADFDAEFFGMDAAEAARLDPQHRLFLEQSWVALEDAGCDPARYPGTIGVFAGSSASRYFLFHLFGNPAIAEHDPDDWEGRLLTGVTADHLPTQVAYRLGLTGPAIAVQSACASSLVAVCTAAQSLADYRCDLALAGGVAVTSPRARWTPTGLFSKDGRCRAFDASAGGAGLGSGVAVLALKRLGDAVADRDQIHAALRGWAVNNDGSVRAGYIAPGVAGQTAVVAEAIQCADVPAQSIGLVEAHASGTPVGDAIEVSALTAAFDTAEVGYCALGTVKANLGNLDSATGATALIKAVHAVREGVIAPHPLFQRANPQIDLARTPFFVPTVAMPWAPTAWPRRAGVSSFGMGGTNAHVIVEQAPDELRPAQTARLSVLPLSARTSTALAETVRQLIAFLDGRQLRLTDVAYTLAARRRAFAARAAVLCSDLAGARSGLVELAQRLAAGGQAVVVAAAGAESEAGALATERQAATWANGGAVDWTAHFAGLDCRVVSLPGHPFDRRRHWIDPAPERRTT